MDVATSSYWSIDACGWVRSPARDEVVVPDPRVGGAAGSGEPGADVEVVELGEFTGVPV